MLIVADIVPCWQLRRFVGSAAADGGSALRLLAFGARAFIRFKPEYLKPAHCRWRPCQETASLLAPQATRRVLRLAPAVFVQLLHQLWLPLDELKRLAAAGECTGLEALFGAGWPELTVAALGGLYVGLIEPPNPSNRGGVPAVTEWVGSLGSPLADYADEFESAGVDGPALLKLTAAELAQDVGMTDATHAATLLAARDALPGLGATSSEGMWFAAVLTGQRCELFAEKSEIATALDRLAASITAAAVESAYTRG